LAALSNVPFAWTLCNRRQRVQVERLFVFFCNVRLCTTGVLVMSKNLDASFEAVYSTLLSTLRTIKSSIGQIEDLISEAEDHLRMQRWFGGQAIETFCSRYRNDDTGKNEAYGLKIFPRLAEELGESVSSLRKMWAFYRAYPDESVVRNMHVSYSVCCALLEVKDLRLRARLLSRVQKGEWKPAELCSFVRSMTMGEKKGSVAVSVVRPSATSKEAAFNLLRHLRWIRNTQKKALEHVMCDLQEEQGLANIRAMDRLADNLQLFYEMFPDPVG
jgi:hypothetical protein